MMRWPFLLAMTPLVLASDGLAQTGEKEAPAAALSAASIRFERNATDEDSELVFEITGGDLGLTKLSIVAPDGATVVDFSAPVASKMGMRKFLFESPEPADVEKLKAAYPEGVYTFTGTTSEGDPVRGTASLRHELPPTVSFLHPLPDAKQVAVRNVMIDWKPVPSAAAYIVEIEEEKRDVSFVSKLPGSTAQLAVPDGFLVPGTEYKLAIGSVSKDGNVSYVEMSFTTAGKK